MSERRAEIAGQQFEELCAATLRAVSGVADAHLRAGTLYRDQRRVPVHAAHLDLDTGADATDRRARVDAMALLLKHSDRDLHRRLAPRVPVARLVFEMLEQFRVEALADTDLRGLRINLEHRFSRFAHRFVDSGQADTDLGMLMFAVALVCRARILGSAVEAPFDDLLEPTRAGMAPLWGADLEGLRDGREDQASFATHALSIAERVARSVDAAEATRRGDRAANDPRRAIFSLLIDFDDTEGDGFASAESGDSRALGESADGYRVFTRRYDREVAASALARPAQCAELRARLDDLVRRQGVNVARLARLLRQMLATPARDGFDFGEEEGIVDGRRLAQLVASPAERRLFMRARHTPRPKCAFSMLVDCSGSMKNHMQPLSAFVDILARALFQAGVPGEILGFTTGAWSGGRAQRDWLRRGRPPAPGRLNETCHVVFKDAATSWRRARRDIAVLLKPEIFREGVDGEAVEWAATRLDAIDAERRILLVVSDGSPMDTATALANEPFYLDEHLRRVVARRSRAGLDVLGLGVGLDLAPYYERSLAVDLAAGVDTALFLDLLETVRGQHRR